MGQWLGHGAFPAGAWVQSQVRELRSSKPHSKAKKKKEREEFNSDVQCKCINLEDIVC